MEALQMKNKFFNTLCKWTTWWKFSKGLVGITWFIIRRIFIYVPLVWFWLLIFICLYEPALIRWPESNDTAVLIATAFGVLFRISVCIAFMLIGFYFVLNGESAWNKGKNEANS